MAPDRPRPPRIGLRGATGVTGRLVAESLCARPEPATLRLAGRRPDALDALVGALPPSSADLSTATVDLGEPTSLAAFFEGLEDHRDDHG